MASPRAKRLKNAVSSVSNWWNLPRLREVVQDFIIDLGDAEPKLSLAEFSAKALQELLEAYGPIGTVPYETARIVQAVLHEELGNRYPAATVAAKFFVDLHAALAAVPIDWNHVYTLYDNFIP